MIVDIACAADRVRAAIIKPLEPRRIASSIARAVAQWRSRDHVRRRRIVAEIASRSGFSIALLDESIDALLRPFSAEALDAFAVKAHGRAEIVAFIMAGNAAGAGLHEVVIALLAGAGALIKSASSEPFFFAEFAATLAEIDPELGARLAIFKWNRANRDLTAQLISYAKLLVAYGDDATITALARNRRFIGFGSRVSAAVVVSSARNAARLNEIAEMIAIDASLYEQLGCLSPHHVFVVDTTPVSAHDLAARIAEQLRDVATRLPAPKRIPLQDATAIRRVRESARWRAIAGEQIELLESARLDWTVVFDPAASFSVSPGYRTLFVSAVRNGDELARRLEPAAPYLESLAIAAEDSAATSIRQALEPFRIPRICAPGEMQSPTLEWHHGGGAFLNLMTIAQ
jgi:Acyl-CoA reductase (LuxC)